MRVAVLVDCDFYIRRRRSHLKGVLNPGDVLARDDAARVAEDLWKHCIAHVDRDKGEELYRILVYDCPPLSKKVFNPISKQQEDLSKSDSYQFRTDLHKELVKRRSVALRRGTLSNVGSWVPRRPKQLKQLLAGTISASDLSADDIRYHVTQKGVDMKIGLDIASLAYKKLIQRVVLISGDADFVPAAKLARREGVDVVLDPMGQHVGDDLAEHVDGVTTTLRTPKRRDIPLADPPVSIAPPSNRE